MGNCGPGVRAPTALTAFKEHVSFMTNYRKIWCDNFGPIPKDKDGCSYDIHHIDGNHNNNDISNLQCVTIKEHYDIHYSQGDYGACWLIARRMKLSPEEISNIAIKNARKRVEEGTHHFLGGEIQKENSNKRVKERTHHLLGPDHNNKRVENGTHPFLGGEIQRETQNKLVKDGTHHLLGPTVNNKRIAYGTHNFLGGKLQRETNKRRVKEGTHHFLGGKLQREQVASGTHPFQNIPNVECPHCHKIGKLGAMKRWHFDHCKLK